MLRPGHPTRPLASLRAASLQRSLYDDRLPALCIGREPVIEETFENSGQRDQ